MFFFHLYSRKIYDPLVCSRGDRNRSAVIDPAGRPFVSEKKGKDAAKARDRGSITPRSPRSSYFLHTFRLFRFFFSLSLHFPIDHFTNRAAPRLVATLFLPQQTFRDRT